MHFLDELDLGARSRPIVIALLADGQHASTIAAIRAPHISFVWLINRQKRAGFRREALADAVYGLAAFWTDKWSRHGSSRRATVRLRAAAELNLRHFVGHVPSSG